MERAGRRVGEDFVDNPAAGGKTVQKGLGELDLQAGIRQPTLTDNDPPRATVGTMGKAGPQPKVQPTISGGDLTTGRTFPVTPNERPRRRVTSNQRF
jgi:hypothetical protein